MKKPLWLNREDCIAIHEMMLSQHGGIDGVRDEGMLASALAKPRHRLAYGHPDLAELGASYAAGVVLNHPFFDGNKRTGFMLAAASLELNGLELTATEQDIVEHTVALAAGSLKEPAYAAWLRKNSKRRR